MPTSFLARHHDPALDLDGVGPREELERGEVARLERALAVVIYAGSIPRRIGGEVSDEELALDKKRARRTGHALNQALRGWKKTRVNLEMSPEVKAEGAVIDWQRWGEAHLTELRNRLACLATWAIRNGEESWGKQAVVKLENEINWVEYALRD